MLLLNQKLWAAAIPKKPRGWNLKASFNENWSATAATQVDISRYRIRGQVRHEGLTGATERTNQRENMGSNTNKTQSVTPGGTGSLTLVDVWAVIVAQHEQRSQSSLVSCWDCCLIPVPANFHHGFPRDKSFWEKRYHVVEKPRSNTATVIKGRRRFRSVMWSICFILSRFQTLISRNVLKTRAELSPPTDWSLFFKSPRPSMKTILNFIFHLSNSAVTTC